jgi:DNA-binding LytR/AlgR family response regulator
VLIVDDEALARQRLRRLLGQQPGVEVVGEAEDAEETLLRVAERNPDLLFLDVRLPGLDGLSLAARHADLPPVIFVTAHDEYAVRAFEVNAVDYLLKPVRAERLAQALARARGRTEGHQAAFQALTARAPAIPRVVALGRGVLRLFDARAVARFWSSDKYTVFLADGVEQLTQEPLVELETRLATHGFLRVHRAELINVAQVRALHVVEGIHEVELLDGQRARVSRRLLGHLRSALGLE